MDGLLDAERALRTAEPHALLDVTAEALRRLHGASGVELRMADYGLTMLQSVHAPPRAQTRVSLHNSPQGRAFGAQEPVVVPDLEHRSATVHLPVAVRGDRVGVLSVTLPSARVGQELLRELEALCEALGHEIRVAERDTDAYLVARRASRLTLAAEMQWELLPGRACARAEFALGAQLEPAYAVYGDSFDWSASADQVTVAVTNGMGEGIDASLLTSLSVNALRNARRSGLDLAGQAVLADQAVYAQYRGQAHVSVLLLRCDLATGEVAAVDAGSPRLWRMRAGAVERVTFDAQLPLGMFEDTPYTAERFRMRPGDRLLVGSDGVYGALSRTGEAYGERALARTLAATRLLPPAQVPQAVLRELGGHRGGVPAEDDAVVLCLDWYGRAGRETGQGAPGREGRATFAT